MALTSKDLSRIANLARLEPSVADNARLLEQLNGFFKLVEQMHAVDTSHVEPLYTPLSVVQEVHLRLRSDVVTEPASEAARDRAQANAPAVEDGLFLVPRVIE